MTIELLAIKGFSDLDCTENIVQKGEFANFLPDNHHRNNRQY